MEDDNGRAIGPMSGWLETRFSDEKDVDRKPSQGTSQTPKKIGFTYTTAINSVADRSK